MYTDYSKFNVVLFVSLVTIMQIYIYNLHILCKNKLETKKQDTK